MSIVVSLLIALAVGVAGFVLAWLMTHKIGERSINSAREQAKRMITEAEKEVQIKRKEAALEAREEWLKIKATFEQEMDAKRRDLEKYEKKSDERVFQSQQDSVVRHTLTNSQRVSEE